MQHGDNTKAVAPPKEERDALLDARYREEGWGLICDQVWNGRVRPIDVESRARDVLRWAYEQIRESSGRIAKQDTEIIQLQKDLEEAAHYAGIVARQGPQIEGLKAALRLKDLELAKARLETAKARAEAADIAGNLAASEVVLAELKVERYIGSDSPTRINPRSLRDWLTPKDEGGCCAEC
jgi:hypothetical protein